MKKWIAALLILGMFLSLSACRKKPEETEAPTTESSTQPQEPSTEPTTEPTEESTQRTEALSIVQYASFNGVYVEDGSDEAVEDIACLLVRNDADGYLDYAVIRAQIGETEGEFVVTGLPAGKTVWVLEKNRLPIAAGDGFAYVDQTVSQLRQEQMVDERVQVDFANGSIQLTNVSQESLSSVRVYYKQIHKDGNLLGGITYTVQAESLGPGQSTSILSGHSKESGCELVRVDCGVE